VQYYRTIKLGMGVQRIEIEEETTQAIFEALWALTEGCRIRKRRYLVQEGSATWEIDLFLDRELVLAEIELASAEITPEIPQWLSGKVVEDVSERAEYTKRFHSSPRTAAGINMIPGEKRTAARRLGVRAFSGKAHAKTTSANCISKAITKLEAAHHPALTGSS
jgi:hypothetical protein